MLELRCWLRVGRHRANASKNLGLEGTASFRTHCDKDQGWLWSPIKGTLWFLDAVKSALDRAEQEGMLLEQLQQLRQLALGGVVEVFRWR